MAEGFSITVASKGDLKKTIKFLESLSKRNYIKVLNKYGAEGARALEAATPKDTGKTASSWHYDITQSANSSSINFYNSNVNKGVNIAIILQYGHGTGTGGWVEGRDYINPALRSVFDNMAEAAWKEVTNS